METLDSIQKCTELVLRPTLPFVFMRLWSPIIELQLASVRFVSREIKREVLYA